MSISQDNKRIAKNTIYLYIRMLVLMFVSMFTSRIVLKNLGVEDYGLNNVVAGFVGMLTFFNNLLSQGTSRFITLFLGKGDKEKTRHVFSACLSIHILIGLIVLLLTETVGLWVVNTKLNINPDRMYVANIVYQLSILSTFLSIIQTPFSSLIIAHERMSIYAYMSIFETVSKLLIALSLIVFTSDKLILYAVLCFAVTFLSLCIYRIYCQRNFDESTYKLSYDKQLYREIFTYSGWNTIGAIAFLFNGEGINIILNIFFGTVINASRAIANTLANIVTQFINNFQNASGPQIIVLYSQNRYADMERLIINSSKYSVYLFIIPTIPLFLEAHQLLHIWLGEVPDYSTTFTRMVLIQILISSIDSPVGRGIHATGRMKLPNLTSALVYLAVLPVTYMALSLGANPTVAYMITICAYPIATVIDVCILRKYTGFHPLAFTRSAIVEPLLILLAASIVPTLIYIQMPEGYLRLAMVAATSVPISCLLIYRFGISKSIRVKLKNKIKSKLYGTA